MIPFLLGAVASFAQAGGAASLLVGPHISDLAPDRLEVTTGVEEAVTGARCEWSLRARALDRTVLTSEMRWNSAPGVKFRHDGFQLNSSDQGFESYAVVQSCDGKVVSARRYGPIHPIPSNPATPLRFSVIADSQGEVGLGQWIVPAVENAQSDFVIHAGDVVEHGEKLEEWRNWFDSLSELVTTRFVATAIGNHDYDQYAENPPDGWRTRPTADIWDALTQGRRWRVLDYPQVRIFLLDSNLNSMSEAQWQAQLKWLRLELAQRDSLGRMKIAVFHHPPFANSVHNWDKIRLSDTQPHEYVRLRSELVPLLEKGGVRMVFNGHAHHYERSRKNGVTYVTAGAINTYRLLPGMPEDLEVNPDSEKLVTLQWTITHCTLSRIDGVLGCETRNREGATLDEFEVR